MKFYKALLGLFFISLVFSTNSFKINSIDEFDGYQRWLNDFNPYIHNFYHYAHMFENWLDNHRFIEETNRQNLGYRLGHNQFSGMNLEEYKNYMSLEKNSIEYQRNIENRLSSIEISEGPEPIILVPNSIDWRTKGVVTPVKDQGQCGSCYSFSNTGALEGAYAIKYGHLESFSEQQIVDCSQTKYGGPNYGCNGGQIGETMAWIGKYGGLCLETDYPYVSGVSKVASTCKNTCRQLNGTRVVSYSDIKVNSDSAMLTALAQQPVAVGVEADQRSFQFYSSGVFTGTCGTNIDHAVLLVGYGTDRNGVDYYILKNSWGTSWGDDGYMYLGRGSNYNNGKGQCGVLMAGSIPNL
jgi:C1A family cysteine protease